MKIEVSDTLLITDNKRVPTAKIGSQRQEVLLLELYNPELQKEGIRPLLSVQTDEIDPKLRLNQVPKTRYEPFVGFDSSKRVFEKFDLDFSEVESDGVYSPDHLTEVLKADLRSKGLLTKSNEHLWDRAIIYPTKRGTGKYRVIPGYLENDFQRFSPIEKELALKLFIEIMRKDADVVYTKELNNASNALILAGYMPLFASYKRDAFKGFQETVLESLRQVVVREVIEGMEVELTNKIEKQQEIYYVSIPIAEQAVRQAREEYPDTPIKTLADFIEVKIREEF